MFSQSQAYQPPSRSAPSWSITSFATMSSANKVRPVCKTPSTLLLSDLSPFSGASRVKLTLIPPPSTSQPGPSPSSSSSLSRKRSQPDTPAPIYEVLLDRGTHSLSLVSLEKLVRCEWQDARGAKEAVQISFADKVGAEQFADALPADWVKRKGKARQTAAGQEGNTQKKTQQSQRDTQLLNTQPQASAPKSAPRKDKKQSQPQQKQQLKPTPTRAPPQPTRPAPAVSLSRINEETQSQSSPELPPFPAPSQKRAKPNSPPPPTPTAPASKPTAIPANILSILAANNNDDEEEEEEEGEEPDTQDVAEDEPSRKMEEVIEWDKMSDDDLRRVASEVMNEDGFEQLVARVKGLLLGK